MLPRKNLEDLAHCRNDGAGRIAWSVMPHDGNIYYRRLKESTICASGEIVKPFGMVAMVEFMSRSTLIGTSLRCMTRDAAHPNIKPMLDCYHFWAGLCKFEDLELIRGEIHHVHFQDTPDVPREMLDHTTRIVPGEGVTPLVRILQKLREKGYRGALSVGVFAGVPAERSLRGGAAHSRERRTVDDAGRRIVNAESVIRAEHLTKRFRSGAGEIVVFENVDLEIQRGERLALVVGAGQGVKEHATYRVAVAGLRRNDILQVKDISRLAETQLADFRTEIVCLAIHYLLPNSRRRKT
jgi:hypothetical protein